MTSVGRARNGRKDTVKIRIRPQNSIDGLQYLKKKCCCNENNNKTIPQDYRKDCDTLYKYGGLIKGISAPPPPKNNHIASVTKLTVNR